MSAPWDQLHDEVGLGCSEAVIKDLLLDAFRISKATLRPEKDVSLKPFVLLFDEYYTDMYRMSDALERLHLADVMIFMGTSFSVGITSIALEIALKNNADVHIVDPEPIDLGLNNARYHTMKAIEFIELAAALGV